MSPQAGELTFTHRFEPGSSGRTLLLLHGTGGDEHDLIPLARRLAPHDALLSPRGQVLEGSMPRFFARLAPGVLDLADLARRADELAAFVRAAIEHYELDPAAVVALGLSNGANIAVALLLRHPGLLPAAALLRPMLPYEPEVLPELTGTRVLIAAGERDPFTASEQTRALADLLAHAGAEVDLSFVPAGHELAAGDLQALEGWLS